MIGSKIGSRLGEVLYRRAASLLGGSRDPYRTVYGLAFWIILVLTYTASVALQDEYWDKIVPITLIFATLVAAYRFLPWERPMSKRGMVSLVAFAPLMVLFEQLLDGGQIFEMLVVAHAVYLFGLRGGLLYAIALAPFVFAGTLVENSNALHALGRVFYTTVLLWIVSAICAAAVGAGKRHEQTRALLAELETAHSELGRANTELARRATQIKELTLFEERARMAREMHDTVGHHLTVINLQLENARASRAEPEVAWEKVSGAKTLVLEALSEVRRSVRALKPLALEEKAGTGSLAALAGSFDGTGLGVSFEVVGEERELPGEVALVLYRTMQEGLTNTAKHAKARQVRATLSFGVGSVKLAMADDGSGVSSGAEEVMEHGFGLSGLRERVEALGGTLLAGDLAKGGFTLESELPTSLEVGETP